MWHCSVTQSCLTPCDPTVACQASRSFTISQSLLKLMSIESLMPSNHLILCHPLLLAFNLSQHQGLFQWVSSSHQVGKLWSFSFSVSPSNEYSGLISLKFDWFDLRAVQGAHKTLVQHQSSKASILQYSAFMVQLSHTYMTTRKTVALTRQPFVVK